MIALQATNLAVFAKEFLSPRFRATLVGKGHSPYDIYIDGAVAQLGERCVRNAEVEGSIPFGSTVF